MLVYACHQGSLARGLQIERMNCCLLLYCAAMQQSVLRCAAVLRAAHFYCAAVLCCAVQHAVAPADVASAAVGLAGVAGPGGMKPEATAGQVCARNAVGAESGADHRKHFFAAIS